MQEKGVLTQCKWKATEIQGALFLITSEMLVFIISLCLFPKLLKWKVKVKVTHLCLTLCNPMDYTVHEILQARILGWVAFSFSRRFSQPRNWTWVSYIAAGFFTNWVTREALDPQ